MECLGAYKVENVLVLQLSTYKGTVNWNLGRGDFSIYNYLILERSDRNCPVYLSKVHRQPKYFKIISQLKNCDRIHLRIYKRKSFSLLKTLLKCQNLFIYLLFNYLFLKFFYYLCIFFFISWRLITLQYCGGFCHTLTWISHGFTCVPHPDPPSHLPLHPIPLGLPSAPGPSTCLMHPTWAGGLFHPG